MKRYTDYKDSGIEWIGEIPSAWKIIRTRFLCNITTGDKDTVNSTPEGIYPFYVRSPNIERIDTYTFDGEAVLMAGDGVGAGKVFHYVNGKFDYHQRVYNFYNFKSILGKYFYLYIQENFKKEVEKGTAKSTVDSIRLPMIKDFPVALPPLETQEKIIAYIDKKILGIDTLIADKQKLIDLLKEERQSVISEAVTKGLDKNAKMKDSGVEWIGEIPKSWKVTKIKYNTYVKGRIGWQGLKSDEFIDEGAYLVTGTDLINGRICWDTCYHIGDERYNEAPEIQLKNEDLLITKDGTIGKVAIVKDMPYKSILNSGLFVIRPLEEAYSAVYMYWLLNSKVFWDYYGYLETGSTIKHLYQEIFVNFSFPLPPVEEQTEIVFFLDQKTSAIDSLISDITSQIEKLKEYRQSIISEAVTGKVAI